ncbi:NUDIX hydrolase [Mobiluncus curtisii]|uniref:NUDIX hydrolase n=1 Tax=Mobiluncus curtisii TaxID=2051 RepID=UPI00146FF0C6|nr:NUDIX domain-containing protein [Mobiluncus curtisii]NMW44692.1 NUDIX domain-containing protein [Mobiluncus curtisii]NMW83454.1 NUDIX domain-containing protein [Mobiluncus curtisii]NMX00035.1 NUDIX domain-containing protein [Mobiluncus curtisii]NMX05057.1 NUDIX domain-containing protein [Mobiluncus curtisii]
MDEVWRSAQQHCDAVPGAGLESDTQTSLEDYFLNEWPQDEDGYNHRQAARVVAFNSRDELLLLRGHDFSDFDHWWWFTVGGGLETGEDPRAGAIREFFEETGYRLQPDALVGPVLRRHATFEFHALTCRQDELFFLTWLPGEPVFVRDGFTAVEQKVLDEMRWWNLSALQREIADGAVVYPQDLVSLARGWVRGWDGTCPEISEGTVGKRRPAG